MSISVQLSAASLHYAGAARATFSGLNLNLPAKKWTCLLGPSGCGKTSLLRLLAGLIDSSHQQSGEISCSDGLSIDNRISYMAQQDLLLPWLNVLDNVCLKARLLTGKVSAAEQQKARQLLAQLNLSGIEKSLPDQLSGGMRQRGVDGRAVLSTGCRQSLQAAGLSRTSAARSHCAVNHPRPAGGTAPKRPALSV